MLSTKAAAVFEHPLINAAAHSDDLGDAVLGDMRVWDKHNQMAATVGKMAEIVKLQQRMFLL